MAKEELIELSSLNNDLELWRGTKLRHKSVGMNVPQNLDYYDYIMAYPGWDSSSMALVNITKDNHKAGSVYGGSINTFGGGCVNKSALQFTLGEELENWYLLKEQ